MTFSIKDFFSKRDQIRSFLMIWSHLLKKSLIENVVFWAVFLTATAHVSFLGMGEWVLGYAIVQHYCFPSIF